MNTAQLTGTPDGRVVVPTYDWQTFLYEHTKKLVGIKSFHHLRFSSAHKGSVFVRETSDGPEVEYKLLKNEWSPTATDLPECNTPSGLSANRQWYLFNKIREFCPEEAQDVTCPKPGVPEPSAAETTASSTTSRTATTTTTSTTAATAISTAPADLSEPAPKKPRRCGICREEGHNARSCPTKI